jgi:hypothetical protein
MGAACGVLGKGKKKKKQ